MGCTGSKSEILSIFRHENRKRSFGSWIRRKIRKVGENQTSRTSSRIQNVSEILRKSSPVPAKPNSPRPSSKLEIAMTDAIEKNKSEEISVLESLKVNCRAEDDDDASLEVMEEKIKLWQIEACLTVNSCRPKAAKGPRKPPAVFTSNNPTDGLSAEFRKLEQDMEDVIDGKDQGKSLSDTSADKRTENGIHSAGRVVSVNDFCISQISNDRRVRPKAAHGFRTPNTVVSAEEYVLPGAVLDMSDVEAQSHLSVNGSKAKQDQCLLAWMERQASKDALQ